MAKRDNHYEAAFEAYLRERRVAYVAVDEQRRSRHRRRVAQERRLPRLARRRRDAAGRREGPPVSQRATRHKQYWRNWTTWDDLRSLARWQDRLGDGSLALFGFVYHVVGERSPLPAEQLFAFRDRAVRDARRAGRRLHPLRPAAVGQMANRRRCRRPCSARRRCRSTTCCRSRDGRRRPRQLPRRRFATRVKESRVASCE